MQRQRIGGNYGARVTDMLVAGGQLLDASEGRWRIADPEGNEVVIVAEA